MRPGRTVIFVGILEKVIDDMNRAIWQPQMEGGKAARELPGIVDQVMTIEPLQPEAGPDGRDRPGGTTPIRAARGGSSAGPATRSACRPRTAPAAST